MSKNKIFLSPPHRTMREAEAIQRVLDSNYLAPVGHEIDMFEQEFCKVVGSKAAVALNSGTSALHLALVLFDVKPADHVLCSSFTFAASANVIRYCHAKPVFIDSGQDWQMSPEALEIALEDLESRNIKPKACIVTHLYGRAADMIRIVGICNRFDVPVIEDAAESLGTAIDGKHTGTFGKLGVSSFNGNKIITTSAGGMLFSDDEDLIARAKWLAFQARRPGAVDYLHDVVGYNYRMSNILAAIGRVQLETLDDRVKARRRNNDFYGEILADTPGLWLMPERGCVNEESNCWLTCITIDKNLFGTSASDVARSMNLKDVEVRKVWTPLHLLNAFANYHKFYGCSDRPGLAAAIAKDSICLPSGSQMSEDDLSRVVTTLLS